MRAALLCDVDQSVYHVGDEAIAAASEEALCARGVSVVRISRGEKHGPGGTPPVRSIPALTFPWGIPDRARYLREIRDVLEGREGALPRHDKLFAIREAFADVDVLVIGGGGCLTSRYGWLLSERLATALVARAAGARVVLSGQSLGPELTPADAELLGELLDLCELAGLRDPGSLALARRLRPRHPALFAMPDAAVGLSALASPPPREDLISVTVSPESSSIPAREHQRVMAAVIDGLARRTGAPVQLVAHMADPDTGGADLAMHAHLAELLETPAQVLPLELAEAAARRTASARWVVTTRFHPVVFGLMGGARILPLPVDRYSRSRMDGALDTAGTGVRSVPASALWDPASHGPAPLVEPLLDAVVGGPDPDPGIPGLLRERSEAWWDHLAAVLHGEAQPGDAPAAAVTPPATRGSSSGGPRLPAAVRDTVARHVPPVAGVPAPDPAVSIVMRTKDRPLLLERAVQDVLAQSRADWELVVVNDGGDAPVVGGILAAHRDELAGRARVIHHAASLGMEAASNAGIAAGTAPLIAIHDDDDTWGATFLQETVRHLELHPEHAGVAVRLERVLEHENGRDVVEDSRTDLWPAMRAVTLTDLMSVNRMVPINVLYRRSVHAEVGPYREDLPVIGDYDFYLRVLQRRRLGFLDRPLAQWRQRPSARGAASNSMFAVAEEHRRFDAELRDEHFRAWTAEHGLGLPMFLAGALREQGEQERAEAAAREQRLLEELAQVRGSIEALHERVGHLERAVAASGLRARAERLGEAVRRRAGSALGRRPRS